MLLLLMNLDFAGGSVASTTSPNVVSVVNHIADGGSYNDVKEKEDSTKKKKIVDEDDEIFALIMAAVKSLN